MKQWGALGVQWTAVVAKNGNKAGDAGNVGSRSFFFLFRLLLSQEFPYMCTLERILCETRTQLSSSAAMGTGRPTGSPSTKKAGHQMWLSRIPLADPRCRRIASGLTNGAGPLIGGQIYYRNPHLGRPRRNSARMRTRRPLSVKREHSAT